jgi:citrate lyase subunit beta/citryl-CoA lyase
VRLPGGCSSGDAASVINAGITGVVVPKVRSAADIATFGEVLAETGSAVGMIALIETALGLQQVDAIAAVPGVVRLMSGEVDMVAELGVDPDDDLAWRPIRSRIVVASAAARLVGPIGPVSVDYSNPETLSAQARMLRRQGFRAGAAIHPNQIDPYLRGYAPDPEEIAAARQVIERYETALAEGRGTVVDNAGHMVDEATVKGARRLIEEG